MAWNLIHKPKREASLFDQFQNQVNKLFDDFWKQDSDRLLPVHFTPTMDVSEDETAIRVRADLPGLDEKDIQIELKDRLLTIRGERKVENETSDKKSHIREVAYGCFQRTIGLPDGIQDDQIQATYSSGVLAITIPKDETKAPKQIKVQVA